MHVTAQTREQEQVPSSNRASRQQARSETYQRIQVLNKSTRELKAKYRNPLGCISPDLNATAANQARLTTFVPAPGWISFRSAILVGLVHLSEKILIKFAVDSPVLQNQAMLECE